MYFPVTSYILTALKRRTIMCRFEPAWSTCVSMHRIQASTFPEDNIIIFGHLTERIQNTWGFNVLYPSQPVYSEFCCYASTPAIDMAGGITFSGFESVHPFLVNKISQECLEGISLNSTGLKDELIGIWSSMGKVQGQCDLTNPNYDTISHKCLTG